MSWLLSTVRILRYSALGGLQDFAASYTWKTWTMGWLLRVIVQVIFFTLIGELVGSARRVHYLLVGNAVLLASMTVMFVVQSTTWERMTGTIPLLIAAPANPLIVLLGRSVQWIPDAIVSALAAFFVVGPVFGLEMPFPRVLWVVPLVVLITLATYFMGAFFGSLVLRFMQARNLVANLVHGAMMAFCGVNVPVSFFPGWVEAIAQALPLTHGLAAVRGVLAGAPASAIFVDVALEALVGLLWLGVAAGSFTWFLEGGRRDGSIEFAS